LTHKIYKMTSANKLFKLLIVDDSYLLQSRLKKAVSEMDTSIDIRQAFNCAEAIQLFSEFELIHKFKKENPAIVQVIFTNYPIDKFRSICIKMGAKYFIDKSDLHSLLNT